MKNQSSKKKMSYICSQVEDQMGDDDPQAMIIIDISLSLSLHSFFLCEKEN